MKRISILGSTGSIGQNTLDLVRQHPDRFAIDALVACKNVSKLIEQAIEFKPKYVALADESLGSSLSVLKDYGIDYGVGEQAIAAAASRSNDLVMSAIVGMVGLEPTCLAIENSKAVALANKESLVAGGSLVMDLVKKHQTQLLPVDSEHNAIFQVLCDDQKPFVEKIILTASGGPFREFSLEDMTNVTPQQAIKHPKWSMGPKISVDSATMMNKGLEMIEAAYLFDLEPAQIDCLIHPQSIIHSLVNFKDGSFLAQLGEPDMRIPISYCLAYPQRISTSAKQLDLASVGKLEFYAPDEARFPCISLAKQALASGPNACVMLNAANEVAVEAFLNNRIGFLDIAKIIEKTLENLSNMLLKKISDVIVLDALARRIAVSLI